MSEDSRTVVIVGGGTAGWLTAAVIAAEQASRPAPAKVILIESPNVPTIGVGEGTWPSLRMTLKRIGLSERDLLQRADASFKQGTCFESWSGGQAPDRYLHPFSLPADYAATNLAEHWLAAPDPGGSFAECVSPQSRVINQGLAPKQAGTPEYAFAVNYGYHLDAGKFAVLLREHSVKKLGVQHVLADVEGVELASNGDISAVRLASGAVQPGMLFVDCTGQRALLLHGQYGVGLVPVDRVLFNDRAIAVQVPHRDCDTPIPSVTRSTALASGWVWDIALPQRRGIGYVYSSAFVSDDQAQTQLESYLRRDLTLSQAAVSETTYRKLRFQPGYRRQFWVRNCVAVGMSAGFVEPLEASAIALIEQSAALIARQLPADRAIMDVVARGFNEKVSYHWRRIVEFLKLHYAVSARADSEYWVAHRQADSWPDGLCDKLTLWGQQTPYHLDAPMLDELFPSASYQYVLYGMGFRPGYPSAPPAGGRALQIFQEIQQQAARLVGGLPTNRALLRSLVNE